MTKCNCFFSEVASTILVDLRTCEHHSHSKTIKILSFVSTLKRACVHIPFFPGAERSPILVRHRVKGRIRLRTRDKVHRRYGVLSFESNERDHDRITTRESRLRIREEAVVFFTCFVFRFFLFSFFLFHTHLVCFGCGVCVFSFYLKR